MEISRDERGPYLVLPFERADEVRGVLSVLGIAFEDDPGDGAGCAGPVWTMLRLDEASLDRAGGERVLRERL